MRMALLMVAALSSCGGATAASPEEAIGLLASRSYSEREAASKTLDALGTAALPALQKTRAESANPEVQQRVSALIARIQRRSDSILLTQAKPVAIDFKDRPLSSAVADLRSKTGIPLVLDPSVKDKLRPITLKLDELPPWQAVERFCEAVGLRETLALNAKPEPKLVRPGGRPGRFQKLQEIEPGVVQPLGRPDELAIVLVDGKNTAASDSTGGVRIRALPMSYAGSGLDPNAEELRIHFDVAPQPALNWIRTREIRIVRATSETGRKLTPIWKPDGLPVPIAEVSQDLLVEIDDLEIAPLKPTRTNARAVPVSFKVDGHGAKSLKSVEGVIVGEILRSDRPIITIDDLAAAKGESFGHQQSTLTVVSMTSDAKSGSTKLVLRIHGPSSPNEFAGHRGLWNDIALSQRSFGTMLFFDAEGRAMKSPVHQGVSLASDDGLSQTYETTLRFGSGSSNIAPKPFKLVVMGTELVTVEVPFKLKDVPLE